MDVQEMLKKAIIATKDISIDGNNEMLSEYLIQCIKDNEYYTEYWLRQSVFNYFDRIYQKTGDYYDNNSKWMTSAAMLYNYIGTNKSLYKLAENVLNTIKNDVIDLYKTVYNINIDENTANEITNVNDILTCIV